MNVHGVYEVRQNEIQTAEPLVPESIAFEVEKGIEKLKRHKSPGIDQILAELIKAGCETICPELHKLVNSVWNKKDLPEQWKELIIVHMYKKGDETHCTSYRGMSLLSSTYKILSKHPAVKVNSICRENYWESVSVST